MIEKYFPNEKINRRDTQNIIGSCYRIILILLITVIALRSILALLWSAPMDADECAEALMSMDILKAPKLIVGWMGQDYMGSLEIYLLAGFSLIAGWSANSIRLLILLLVVGQLIILTYILCRAYGSWAASAALISMSIISPFAFDWELRARNYQLMLLLVLLAMALQIHLLEHPPKNFFRSNGMWLILGTLLGIAIWTNELAVLLMPPFFVFLFTNNHARKIRLLYVGIGMCFGLLPRIIYNLRNEFENIKYLVGSLTHITRGDFEAHVWASLFKAIQDRVGLAEHYNSILTSLGLPLIFLLLMSILLLAVQTYRRRNLMQEENRFLFGLGISIMAVMAVAIKPRYGVIAIPYISLFIGMVLQRIFCNYTIPSRVLVIIIVILSLSSVISVSNNIRGLTSLPEEQLTAFLDEKGYDSGISGYDAAHEVMFYSRGSIAVSSLGGPIFTTRLMSVERSVAREGAQFIIFEISGTNERVEDLKHFFLTSKINFESELISQKYIVFHSFSRRIYPGEFLLEDEMPHFKRHVPSNVIKQRQERANTLLGMV